MLESVDVSSLARSTIECLDLLQLAEVKRASFDLKAVRKSHQKLAEDLASMVFIMNGSMDQENNDNLDLALELVHTNLLHTELFERLCSRVLLLRLPPDSKRLEMRMKRDMLQLFRFMLRESETADVFEEYMDSRAEILKIVLMGCLDMDSVAACQAILHACVRRESICQLLLESDLLDNVLSITRNKNFQLATGGFQSLELLLLKHPAVGLKFLMENYDAFVKEKLSKLVRTRNYVNKRLALKLIYKLLTTRKNFKFMIRFVTDADNLELIMAELLSKKNQKKIAVQTEACDIFKIFVANPKKPPAIQDMLRESKRALIRFMGRFQEVKRKEENFNSKEFNMILNTLQML